MKKIALIALRNINNIGEDLLDINTEYIIRSIMTDIDIKRVELLPNKYELGNKFLLDLLVYKFLKIISEKFIINKNLSYKIKALAYKFKLKRYMEEKLKNVDSIVYSVGMLKYTTQDFSYIFYIINKIAKKYNISVFMSAMSIEEADLDDWRCKQLIEAMSCSSVKMVTTRDTEQELNILKNVYLKNNLICKFEIVGDPALWTSDFIKMKEKKNKKIGIGLIRTGIYKDYGNKELDDKYVLNLYKDIIQELEKRKMEWSLFCNGMQEDYEVGISLLKELNLSNDKLMPKPNSPQDLINILSNFKVVLGARLHCCITSYTYDIPIVGLIWDNKLRAFARKIEWYDNFVEKEDLNAKYIVNKLIEIEDKKYNKELFYQLKKVL